jgi:hypothetical protein
MHILQQDDNFLHHPGNHKRAKTKKSFGCSFCLKHSVVNVYIGFNFSLMDLYSVLMFEINIISFFKKFIYLIIHEEYTKLEMNV